MTHWSMSISNQMKTDHLVFWIPNVVLNDYVPVLIYLCKATI